MLTFAAVDDRSINKNDEKEATCHLFFPVPADDVRTDSLGTE
jgi:hypothetical protein